MIISQWLVIGLLAFGLLSNFIVLIMRQFEDETQKVDDLNHDSVNDEA